MNEINKHTFQTKYKRMLEQEKYKSIKQFLHSSTNNNNKIQLISTKTTYKFHLLKIQLPTSNIKSNFLNIKKK